MSECDTRFTLITTSATESAYTPMATICIMCCSYSSSFVCTELLVATILLFTLFCLIACYVHALLHRYITGILAMLHYSSLFFIILHYSSLIFIILYHRLQKTLYRQIMIKSLGKVSFSRRSVLTHFLQLYAPQNDMPLTFTEMQCHFRCCVQSNQW